MNKFGFTQSESRSTDHRWYELHLEGLPIIATRVSRNNNDIGSKLEGMIARQLRVRNPFFKEMIECTKSKEDYEHQVRNAPYPPWEHRF